MASGDNDNHTLADPVAAWNALSESEREQANALYSTARDITKRKRAYAHLSPEEAETELSRFMAEDVPESLRPHIQARLDSTEIRRTYQAARNIIKRQGKNNRDLSAEEASEKLTTLLTTEVPSRLLPHVLYYRTQEDDPLLLHAVAERDYEAVCALQALGCDLELPSARARLNASGSRKILDTGDTALMVAAREDNYAMMSLLLDLGADPNASNDRGYSALHMVMGAASEGSAKLLINYGAGLAPVHDGGLPAHQVAWMNPDVQHMTKDFIRRVILPAAVMELGVSGDKLEQFWRGIEKDGHIAHLIDRLVIPTSEALYTPPMPDGAHAEQDESMFFRPLRLLRSWQHPPNFFPAELAEQQTQGAWAPLFKAGKPAPGIDYQASNGLVVANITNFNQTKVASEQLDLPINMPSYLTTRACSKHRDQRIHPIALRDANGLVSIAEVMISKNSPFTVTESAPIPPRGKYHVNVISHHGAHNEVIRKGPAHEALKDWVQAVRDGKAKVDVNQLGETKVSQRRREQLPPIVERIGYVPDWDKIDACFNEFKSPTRAASLSRDTKGKLVYEPVSLGDGNYGRNDFISGEYAKGEAMLPMRDMDVQSWLHATGLMDTIHHALQQEFPQASKRMTLQWEKDSASPTIKADSPYYDAKQNTTPSTEVSGVVVDMAKARTQRTR